jgi:serine/threonine protein kinase
VSARTIGTYELAGLLGEGGIGQVYAAHDKVLGRRVAIKMLRPELSRDRNFVDRFYSEAKSLGNLNHTNITTLYSLHAEGDEAFMVMELVHGQTIEALLARVGRLTVRDSLAVLAQAVPAMRYAHRRGVIHRDLKPANLMITEEGVVKVMDFGIARVRGAEHLTRVGEFCGTFVYASPEQIRGEDVDERSDLYSLAIVLYRMIAGNPPFQATNEYALMTAQLQSPPPPLQGQVPNLDAETEQVLMRALAKRSEDRFASVEEFGRAIGASALRGDSVDILQQLYARAFVVDDLEATRVVAARPLPPIEPTMPSNPPPARGDFALPPSLPGPAAADRNARSSRLDQRRFTAAAPMEPPPVPAATKPPRAARRLGFIAAGALAVPLALGGFYLVYADGVMTAPAPAPPHLALQEPSPAPPNPAADTNAASNEALSPPPSPPAATPDQTAKAELPPAPPEILKVDLEPPPPAILKTEPPPIPPAPGLAKTEPSPPPMPPPETARAERSPSETAKAEPEPPPPPPTGRGAAVTNNPNPPPATIELAKNEPAPRVEPPVALGPQPATPPQPEGEPDLQGRVTGAKRLDEIEVAAHWIRIYGIVDNARGAQEAKHVEALVRYLKPSHNHLVCYRKAANTYRCYSDGQDIARLALLEGMVRLAPNAPVEYRSLLAQGR